MTTINWEQIYASENINKWQLPDTKMMNANEGIFRDLFLSTGMLPSKTENGNDISSNFICCDVLLFDKDIEINVNTIIFARRIEVKSDKSITINRLNNQLPELLIYTQEIVDVDSGEAITLSINNISDAVVNTFAFEIKADQNITGLSWEGKTDNPTFVSVDDLDKAFFLFSDSLSLLINSQFQVSNLLSSEELLASISIMRWVAAITSSIHADREIAGQAQSMYLNLTSLANINNADTILVPKLDLSIYANKAQAFNDVLELHEKQWDRLKDRGQDIELWLGDTQLALSENAEELSLAKSLSNQAEETWRKTEQARSIAAAQIVTQQGELTRLQIDFTRGVEKWKRGKIIDDTISLVTGVAEVLVQIPVIVQTGPGLVPGEAFTSIAESAISIAEAKDIVINSTLPKSPPSHEAEDLRARKLQGEKDKKRLIESGEKMGEAAKSAGGGAAKALNAGMNILKTIERANQLEETSENILASTFSATNEAFSSNELQGLDIVTGGSQIWDEVSADIEETFTQIPELREIDGGSNFLLGLKKLFIYGKVLSEARLATSQARAYWAEMRMKQQSAEKTLKLFTERNEDLTRQADQIQALSQRFFTKLISDKRAVYLALESYNRALQYFTLSEGIIIPSMTDSYANFRKTVSEVISGDLIVATKLEHIPQTMELMTFTIEDEETIAGIKKHGHTNWRLPINVNEFKNFGRIRLGEIRVFLKGINSENAIEVKISTSGHYLDKDTSNQNKTHQFVAEPFDMRFVYTDDNLINVRANIAERFKDNYFHPTPFTTWTFDFSNASGSEEKLDFANITSLVIEFNGEITSID